MEAELKKTQINCENLLKEKPFLLDEIDKFRDEVDTYLIALRKKENELEECYKELNTVKAQKHKCITELNLVTKNLNVEKDELYSTRAKLVELYEHYKLLESQLETKTVICQMSESTEKSLMGKVKTMEELIKSRAEEFEKWSGQKELAKEKIDEANVEIEKLLIENERLKKFENNAKGQEFFIVEVLEEFAQLMEYYDEECSRLGKANSGYFKVTGDKEEKFKDLYQQISKVFTEALSLVENYEVLNQKYNSAAKDLQHAKSKQVGTDDDEASKLNLLISTQATQISELLNELESLKNEKNVENEKIRIGFDTAKQKIIVLEKELAMKNAIILQYEEKFTGEPDELLNRIENLKSELESFNVHKGEKSLKSKETDLKQVIERISHAISSIEPNLSCISCLGALTEAVICLPCTHIVCSGCKPAGACKQCEALVNSTVKLPVIDEFSNKISYSRQAVEDMKLILSM